MATYLLRRILAAVPVLGVVSFFVFALLRVSPGDPAMILAGDGATPAQLEAMRHSMGLERNPQSQQNQGEEAQPYRDLPPPDPPASGAAPPARCREAPIRDESEPEYEDQPARECHSGVRE